MVLLKSIPSTMTGILLTGHGGLETLEYRTDLSVPSISADEVLVRVAAAGVNNTDINTRIGWYSKTVRDATDAGSTGGFDSIDQEDASWSGVALQFPRIQGADCCGEIVAVGAGVDDARIGERVLIRSIQQSGPEAEFACRTFGSEMDGAFAQYTRTQSIHAFALNSTMSDIELASFPCAYSTAEGMLDRVSLACETVLITGASGGVGSAAVQLAKRRGARVIAVASAEKADAVIALGADQVIERGDPSKFKGFKNSVDVVVDLVAGPDWPRLLEVMRRGARYVTAGAIAGPIVELDVRSLYLKDLSLFGCTYQPDHIFNNLLSYIERNEIKPLVSQSYPLANIVQAQEDFIAKRHVGKLVLVPPQN